MKRIASLRYGVIFKKAFCIAITDFAPRTLQGKRLPELEHQLIFLNPKHLSDQTPEPYRQWLRAISDSLDETVDETSYPNPPFQRLFKLIERNDISPEERAQMFDEYNFEIFKRNTREEGRMEGKIRAKLETAKIMNTGVQNLQVLLDKIEL